MNGRSIEIEAKILQDKLQESMAARARQQERIEELEERMRDKEQLIANQNAEITELRRRLVGVSEVLDDLIQSEIKSKELIEDCRQVLVKMQAEVDRK